ncbi:molybdenum cofactor guanylyltransferase [Acinetobacter sp.]|uniref:molybdenum cofactor guanylyltransferase n=1 Tax=Acinetobacter sp. TaxID=472 RepID=UPI002FC6BCE4
MQNYPATALVILAGGKATRMNGVNKLLQRFDHEVQLLKIINAFQGYVQEIWINSHRDYAQYSELIPDIRCFKDNSAGFLGPLIGMQTAWSYVRADYILFIPCDITDIPQDILPRLHHTLEQHPHSSVVYPNINGQALYPFCLLKRNSLETLNKHLHQQQFSLKRCFNDLLPQIVDIQNSRLTYHSLNSFEEVLAYQKSLGSLGRP